MDFDKMKQWMEMAQNMSGGDFWKTIFDEEQMKSFQSGHSHFPFQQGDQQTRRNEDVFPTIDIVETHDELQYLLYLPGYRKQDVQLLSYGEYILVKGTRKSFFNEQDFKQKAGKYGDFEKKLDLPHSVQGNKGMQAVFKDGILYISIDKHMGNASPIIIEG